jgi:hypothetical protein
MAAAKSEGGALINGPFGKVNFISANSYESDYASRTLLSLRLDQHGQSSRDLRGVPLAREHRRVGSGIHMIHYGRYQRLGKGQVIVLVDVSPRNPRILVIMEVCESTVEILSTRNSLSTSCMTPLFTPSVRLFS